ncbi:MAG: WD40/YVTN/BNR-like repeat-containing protein [Omnitrophica WOR_2 bacterium]
MTGPFLLVATSDGLAICQKEGDSWREVRRGLEGQDVTCLAVCDRELLAGTRQGIFRTKDRGQSWQEASDGLKIRLVRWLAARPEDLKTVFAGTEPAGIFLSEDEGKRWRACPEVETLRDEYRWYLPYSPRAGCVRGFAFSGERAYAAVEVGGVLRSDDHGNSWSLAKGSSGYPHDLANPPESVVHPDVHSINVHPASPDWVCAPTGGGFYRSLDGGRTWQLLYDCYCRSVWWDPQDANHFILGPADGVDRNGRIEESRDGGQTWQPAWKGVNAPWDHHMVERITQVGDELMAVLSNGELVSTTVSTLDWKPVLPDVSDVATVLAVD